MKYLVKYAESVKKKGQKSWSEVVPIVASGQDPNLQMSVIL